MLIIFLFRYFEISLFLRVLKAVEKTVERLTKSESNAKVKVSNVKEEEEKKKKKSKKKNDDVTSVSKLTLTTKRYPKLKLFFMFKDLYFNDLNEQLMREKLVESIVRSNLDESLVFRNCAESSESVRKFVELYMEKFVYEVVEVPFEHGDEMCKQIKYDANRLDIVWIGDCKLRLFGLVENVNSFKEKIFDNC